eukprot:766026-Hanusia_phi.AAC.1
MPRLPGEGACFRLEGILQGGVDTVIVDREAGKVEMVTTVQQPTWRIQCFLQALIALGVPASAGWNLVSYVFTLQRT